MTREARLTASLIELKSLAVAFSGGVDSAVLLHASRRALGDRAVGVIADSPSLPGAELASARRFAAHIDVVLEVVATDEMDRQGYRVNDGERCYFCKQALFDAMELVARRRGLAALAYGAIADDDADDRPGMRSASERGVRAPLAEAGFTKADVRAYARAHGLPMWDAPASACLASRIPRGVQVTPARLARVERAEAGLRALGLRMLRVRDHGLTARVEVGGDEVQRARSLEGEIGRCLESEGFEELVLARYESPG